MYKEREFFDSCTSHPVEGMTERMQTGECLNIKTVTITLLGELRPDSLIAPLV